MQVLVAGANGALGEAVVAELRSCGYTVRAMVRSGREVAHLHDYGATLEFGNLDDPRSLPRACYGAQALVIALPSRPLARRRGAEPFSSAGVRRLVAAARQSQVGHVVLVSALKADRAPQVPCLVQRHLSEAYLRGSGLRYTILRPATLQEWFGERYPLRRPIERLRLGPMLGRGFGRHSFVAAADVARAARLALERSEALDALVEVGGPEAISLLEAYRRISCASGRRVVPLPIGDSTLRMAGALAYPLLPSLREARGLGALFDREDYIATTPVWLAEALGRRRSFDEYIATIYGHGPASPQGRSPLSPAPLPRVAGEGEQPQRPG